MGDKATLAMARRELEELYLGIPDDSVNLTFEDLAKVKQLHNTNTNPTQVLEPIQEAKTQKHAGSSLTKLPSLDFSRGLEEARSTDHHPLHHHQHRGHLHGHDVDPARHASSPLGSHRGHGHGLGHGHGHGHGSHRTHSISPEGRAEFRHTVEISSMAYDDVSVMSMASTYQDRGQRRRPGIPHSNICTICSTYIYIFRHRCLVCGRLYCRDCVSVGMGEMTEGRKCVECLGRRFSQRYIERAGKVGCCSRYPSVVKQAELKWAEKGPRRTNTERSGYGRSTMMSRSRSPLTPRTPTMVHAGGVLGTPSFVAASSYSPYTPNHHHLPL